MKKGEQKPLFEPDPQIKKTNYFESYYSKKGYNCIAGVDEAGRGPLAGPVVAAAVILPEGYLLDSIKDSKKISEKKREEMYHHIFDIAVAVGVGIVHERQIEQINILNAAIHAMQMAIDNLDPTPDFLLIDGNAPIKSMIPQKTIVQGDSKSISISAASIIAKVTRDSIMYQYHRTYPFFNFKSHKGYGTKEHLEAIKKHGITKIHRRTFAPIKDMIGEIEVLS